MKLLITKINERFICIRNNVTHINAGKFTVKEMKTLVVQNYHNVYFYSYFITV